MKTLKKVLIAFMLGGLLGLGVGGFLGYEIGSVDDRINTAKNAGVVETGVVVRPQKPATEPDATAAAVETPAAASGPEEFVISPNDTSELMWVGYKTVLGAKMSMEGGFANFNGTVAVVNNSPDESYVDFTADINSIFSVSNILTGVLKGEMFFDVAKYPEAKFQSTKIEVADGGYLVTGNFTMHGATKGVQFPAKIERQGDNVYIEAEFKINRKDWNIGYDSFEDAIVLEEVVVSFKMLAEPADPTKAAPGKAAPREVTPIAEAAPAEATPAPAEAAPAPAEAAPAPAEAAPAPAEAAPAPAEAAPAPAATEGEAPAAEAGLDDWLETPTKTMSQQPVI